jgi:hypothetical protein
VTALSVPARPEESQTLRPLPWRRMGWVTWRQHRLALGGVAALLGGLAVYVWIAGLKLHHAYAAALACHPVSSPVCGALIDRFDGMNTFLVNGFGLLGVPALIGAFVGAPVLARELETGTFRYVWTQGFGRWRWTVAKLVSLAIVVTAATGALSLLFSWYYRPYFATGNLSRGLPELSPLDPGLFDLHGIAFAAWTLAAFAIGALAGLLVRRVVVAIVVTLVAYAALMLATGLYLREHYLTPQLTSKFGFNVQVPESNWVIGQWWTKGHTTLSQSTMNQLFQATFERMHPVVHSKAQKAAATLGTIHYFVQHGYTYWTRYQPASRFWPFQLIEAGWLLALAVVLIAATVWIVRRRAA